jgi:hypothetical protein
VHGNNSQYIRRLAKYRRPTDHLASPHVTDEPPYVTDRASDEVARGSAPRAGEHPGERDERKGEVGCGDGEQAEERNGRRGVPAGPKINWYVGERGGEEREVEERGQALKRGRKA